MGAGEQAFRLQIGDVLVDGREGTEIEAARDLLEGRGIAVSLDEAGDEFEDFLLPPCNRHSGHYSE
jgi:hypothetical protein